MPEKIADLYAEITLKSDKFDKDLNQIKAKTKTNSKAVGTSLGSMVGGFAKVGVAIVALKKLWDFSVVAKNAARDAQEMDSKFRTVFSSIESKAVNTAKAFALSFGLATSTAKELLGGTGDLLVGFGFAEEAALDFSRQVAELGVDIASFTNLQGGSKRAIDIITKSLLGEREGLKAIGISIKEVDLQNQIAIDRSNGIVAANDNVAKTMATLTLITQQAGKAIGDYARTSDSLANVERQLDEDLKNIYETVGQLVIPIFQTATEVLSIFLRTLTEDDMDSAIRKLSELGIEGDKLQKILSRKAIVDNLKEIRETMNGIDVNTNKSIFEDFFKFDVDILGGENSFTKRWERFLEAVSGSKLEIELGVIGIPGVEQNIDLLIDRSQRDLEVLRDVGIPLDRKQAKLDATRETLAKLIQQNINQYLDGEVESEGIKDLISFYTLLEEEQARVVDKFTRISKLKKENEDLQKIITGEDSNIIPDAEKDITTLKTLKDKVKELKKELETIDISDTTSLEEKQLEINTYITQIEKLEKSLADLALGTVPSIDLLKSKINDLQDDLSKTDMTDYGTLAVIQNMIDYYNEQLDTLQRRLESISSDDPEAKGYMKGDNVLHQNQELFEPEKAMLNETGTDFIKPIVDGGEEFEGNMLDAASAAHNIAQTLQHGLFEAGSTFVDLMGDSLSIVSNVLSFAGMFASGGTSGIISAIFGHEGGSFRGSPTGQAIKMADGGSVTVPSGYPNDSFGPLFVESGEVLNVTSATNANDQGKLLEQVIGSIQALNANFISKNMSPVVNVLMDGEKLVRNVVNPEQNKLDRESVKNYEY